MNIDAMIVYAEYLSGQYKKANDGKNEIFTMNSEKHGATRTCIISGNYAFKAVQVAKNAVENRSEWDFYAMTTDEIRAKLAKPLYISQNGRVIVMEVCTGWYERTPAQRTTTGYLEPNEEAVKLLVQNTHGFTLQDLHGNNWGVTSDGRAVVLDYGSVTWEVGSFAWRKLSQEEKTRISNPNNYEVLYQKDTLAEMLLPSKSI